MNYVYLSSFTGAASQGKQQWIWLYWTIWSIFRQSNLWWRICSQGRRFDSREVSISFSSPLWGDNLVLLWVTPFSFYWKYFCSSVGNTHLFFHGETPLSLWGWRSCHSVGEKLLFFCRETILVLLWGHASILCVDNSFPSVESILSLCRKTTLVLLWGDNICSSMGRISCFSYMVYQLLLLWSFIFGLTILNKPGKIFIILSMQLLD